MTLQSVSMTNSDVATLQVIKEKADNLLLASGAAGQFPIATDLIAKYLGFSCLSFTPDENAKHISGVVDHKKKIIYINASDSPQKQLFTFAHEVGHIILHGDKSSYVDFRTPQITPKEIEANNFAACLLMPENVFLSQWGKHEGDLSSLSSFFGVSTSAIATRAAKLGVF